MASSETVLRRILDNHFSRETGSIHAKAFANDTDKSTGKITDRHSVSREKYTSAPELRSLAPNPERFGVAAVVVKEYETMSQNIHHTPTDVDNGHCDAIGSKTARVKRHLRKQAVIRIIPPDPSSER